MARPRVRIVPLGGIGEVGKNMTVIEYRNDLVMVDAGAMFPEEEMRGIDLIVADVTYVKQRLDRFRGIVLTHGHEDHVGGMPFVVPLLSGNGPVPIYGSRLAIAYAESKLDEFGVLDKATLHVVEPDELIRLGSLETEFIPVTHSIPGSYAVGFKTPLGWVVHTGDYKFDPTPPLGPPTNEDRLRQIGDEGVLVLMTDAVRVERAGHTPSEAIVSETLFRVIGEATGRAVLTTFASNITRIDQAIKAAYRHGRKVAVAGRSLEQSTRIAKELGYLKPPDDVMVPLDIGLKLPRNQLLLLTTGSQGEASAALSRIASGEHPEVRLSKGDTVIFSATPVPGNEESVSETIDMLFKRGIHVIYAALEPTIHVSGHASRDELKLMLSLLRPRFIVPIHGEYRHLILYRDLAVSEGYDESRVFVPELGCLFSFGREGGRREGMVPHGALLVDILGPKQVILRNREEIADNGFIIATLVLDHETRQLITGPHLVAQNLNGDVTDQMLRAAEADLRKFLDRRAKGGFSTGYLVSRTKGVLSRYIYRQARVRPLIMPVVTEL